MFVGTNWSPVESDVESCKMCKKLTDENNSLRREMETLKTAMVEMYEGKKTEEQMRLQIETVVRLMGEQGKKIIDQQNARTSDLENNFRVQKTNWPSQEQNVSHKMSSTITS